MTEAKDRARLEQILIERAGSDPQFRQDLVNDPRGTMERAFGVTIPEGIQATVLEETPSTVYLVLPPAPASGDDEMSDAQLEAVAGGGYTVSTEDCGNCVVSFYTYPAGDCRCA